MSNIHLFLDNLKYSPGDIIRGKAVCNFRSSKEIRKIRIRLKGQEHTEWIGSESYYDSSEKTTKTREVTYHGHNEFLLRDIIVRGEGTVGAGEHVFPFEFLLPNHLPTTFNHSYGNISYKITATVDRPWKTDYESEKKITIISPIRVQDLARSFLQPVEYSDDKTVCCFCCASGPVQLDVNLDKRAYAVGETACVKVYCMNMSNANVNCIEAEIKMKITFKTTSPSTEYKEDTEFVAVACGNGVGAHSENTYNLELEIPRTTGLPNFVGCEFFKCETYMKVTAHIDGCHSNLEIKTNVALAHVPETHPPPSTAPQYEESAPQYEQSAPPYPMDSYVPVPQAPPSTADDRFQPMPMPMPMPMPVPEFGASNWSKGVPPYPVPGYPTAPPENLGPSAPSNSNIGGNASFEPPPPSYEEAAKHF